jgi:phospholipase/lecithinase/hemolysin
MARVGPAKSAALICACLASVSLAAPAAHAAYDAEYVFGDSLSDNGNAAEFGGAAYPDPPSYHDAYTNGPVAVSLLAQSLGLPSLQPSLWANGFSDVNNIFPPGFVPGTNFAFAGATADPTGQITLGLGNLPQQVSAYTGLVSHVADPSALYVIEIGGNDVISKTLNISPITISNSVMDEIDAITTLAGDGARHFLIVNVPNVGLIPLATGIPGASAAATAYSQEYDSILNSDLATLALPSGTSLHEFDLYTYNEGLLDNALSNGFTNTTQPCYSNAPASTASDTGCTSANINSFVYWNDVHPTAPVQALWAQGMEAAVASPEPSTWAMLLVGFAATGLMGLKASRKERAA